jgi:hypothetical protein
MPYASLWHLYNLRESPYFQQTLRDGGGANAYPVSLFVGRDQDARRLVRTIVGSPRTSRQVVHAPVGYGKTTLVEYVKHELRGQRPHVLAASRPVLVQRDDTANTLALKILSYVYDVVLAHGDLTTRALESVETAKQLIRAFRVHGGGGGVSVGVPGLPSVGISASYSTAVVNPSTAQPLDLVPRLLEEFADVVEAHLGAGSVVVHVNNLEHLSEAEAEHAGAVLRDLRDACFLVPGYHWLLVGTTDAVRRAIGGVPQLRSVFSVAAPLAPLAPDELLALLDRRYAHFRLDPAQPARAPVEPAAVRELYGLFQGDLRGTLRALEVATNELLGLGPADAAAPLTWADMGPVLRHVYEEELAGVLSGPRAEQLRSMARHRLGGVGQTFTQRDLADVLNVSQTLASTVVGEFEAAGYLREAPAEAPARASSASPGAAAEAPRRGRGRPATRYALTGASRLIFG